MNLYSLVLKKVTEDNERETKDGFILLKKMKISKESQLTIIYNN